MPEKTDGGSLKDSMVEMRERLASFRGEAGEETNPLRAPGVTATTAEETGRPALVPSPAIKPCPPETELTTVAQEAEIEEEHLPESELIPEELAPHASGQSPAPSATRQRAPKKSGSRGRLIGIATSVAIVVSAAYYLVPITARAYKKVMGSQDGSRKAVVNLSPPPQASVAFRPLTSSMKNAVTYGQASSATLKPAPIGAAPPAVAPVVAVKPATSKPAATQPPKEDASPPAVAQSKTAAKARPQHRKIAKKATPAKPTAKAPDKPGPESASSMHAEESVDDLMARLERARRL